MLVVVYREKFKKNLDMMIRRGKYPEKIKLTVHRIVHISGEGYLIKGDNTPEPDGRVPASSIIGRVVRVEHRGRQVRIGMGIDRIIIAFLSRRGWLTPVVWTVWRVVKPIAGRCFE